jgi:outer membrane immunogenic protein
MNSLARLTGAAMLATIGVVTPARAAELPIKAASSAVAVSSWTGFYAGLGVGLRSTEAQGRLASASATTAGQTFDLLEFCPVFGCALNEPLNGAAFRVAPYAGFNWQFAPRWVAGIEADWGLADQTTRLRGAKYPETFATPSLASNGLTGDSFAVRTTWDGSLRGRLGHLITPSILLYGTAGVSWLHLETTSNCATVPATGGNLTIPVYCGGAGLLNPSTTSHVFNRLGWTLGGGGEVALWSHWVARAEYRYSDYGSVRATDFQSCTAAGLGALPCIAGGTLTAAYDVNIKTHTATFGLAYKFGDPIASAGGADPQMPAAIARPASWTGPYAGAAIGLRADRTVGSTGPLLQNPPGVVDMVVFCAVAPCALSEPLHGTALRLSPYAGLNWQLAPRWVAGVEADWGWADRTVVWNGAAYPGTLTFRTGFAADSFAVESRWDASLRARAGFLLDPSVMIYATGGAAWLSVAATSTCGTGALSQCGPGLFGPSVISHAAVRPGATVGAGIEAIIRSGWIARAEYRFSDFGTFSNTDSRVCPAVTCGVVTTYTVQSDVRLKSHAAMFGVARSFDLF